MYIVLSAGHGAEVIYIAGRMGKRKLCRIYWWGGILRLTTLVWKLLALNYFFFITFSMVSKTISTSFSLSFFPFFSLMSLYPLQLSLSNPQQQFSLYFLLLYSSLSLLSLLSFTATVLTFPPTPTVSLSCAYSRTFFCFWN